MTKGTTRMERPNSVYFTKVLAVERDFCVLVAFLHREGEDPSLSRILGIVNGSFADFGTIEDVVYGVATRPPYDAAPKGSVCLMGRGGTFVEIRRGGAGQVESHLDCRGAGYVLDLRRIGGTLYAAGTQNLVARQTLDGWVRMDGGVFAPLAGRVDRAINAIDGFGPDDIYAVGLGGQVLHWDGRLWTRLEAPTSVDLTAVLCTSSGDVVIGAGAGMVLLGDRNRGWRDVSAPGVLDGRIERAVELRGQVYLGTADRLARIAGGVLEAVPVEMDGPVSFLTFDAVDGILWAAGDEFVGRWDGEAWTRYASPDNGS